MDFGGPSMNRDLPCSFWCPRADSKDPSDFIGLGAPSDPDSSILIGSWEVVLSPKIKNLGSWKLAV